MTTPPTLPLPVIIDVEVDPPPVSQLPEHRPRQPRADGWTAARQAAFIRVLSATGSVKEAAAAVGMSREGAYRLRDHPDAHAFRSAWAGALAQGFGQLAEYALERVLQGETITVRRDDGRSFTRQQPASDKLVLALMQRFEAHVARWGFSSMPAPVSSEALADRMDRLPDASGWGDAPADLEGAPLPRQPVLLTPHDISAADNARPGTGQPGTRQPATCQPGARHPSRSSAPRVETPAARAARLARRADAAAKGRITKVKRALQICEHQLARAHGEKHLEQTIPFLHDEISRLRDRLWALEA